MQADAPDCAASWPGTLYRLLSVQPSSPKHRPKGARRFGLPIGAWLVLGFAVVIVAFVTASTVAMRSTRDATIDVGRVQNEIEPLTRSARNLGDSAAAFDRAVLAFLRVGSEQNREAVVKAGVELSAAIDQAARVERAAPLAGARLAFEALALHQAEGFQLIGLHDQRFCDIMRLCK